MFPEPDTAAWLTLALSGARALYLSIKTPNLDASRVTLNLNEPITFPKDASFSIVLKYDGKGFFDVVQKPLRHDP